MTSDLAYRQSAKHAASVVVVDTDILDFEFSYGFNDWLLRYILRDIRQQAFPSQSGFSGNERAAETVSRLCDLARSIQAPLARSKAWASAERATVPAVSSVAGLPVGTYPFEAISSSLNVALEGLKGPQRKWAKGKADPVLAVDARDKRFLVNALAEETFAGLGTVAVLLESEEPSNFMRCMKAAEALCESALTLLSTIHNVESLYKDGLDAVCEALDSVVEGDAVKRRGRLAERLLHDVWIRLHDEVRAIEQRPFEAFAWCG